MKTHDFNACIFDSEIYCNECLPDGVDTNSPKVYPIFSNSEWDHYPACCQCGTVHNYVNLTLDEFTQAYLECALWAETDQSNDQGGDPLDKNFTIDDIDPKSLKEAIFDCKQFQKENMEDIDSNFEQAGRDFWFTRNDHGVGFWDGDWPEPAATRLTKTSKQFGNVDICVGYDSTLRFSSGIDGILRFS